MLLTISQRALSVAAQIRSLYLNSESESSVIPQCFSDSLLLLPPFSLNVSTIIRGFMFLFLPHHYCVQSVSQTHTVTHTHTCAHTPACVHMMADKHNHPAGWGRATHSCAETHTHTQLVWIPEAELEHQWAPDVSLAGRHFAIPILYCSNVVILCQYS